MRRIVLYVSLATLSLCAMGAQQPAPPRAEISAGLGPCSLLMTVTGPDAKPVYAARMNTRIQYGSFNLKKLDLEAYTGSDGKLSITGLPESLKKPMTIHVTKGDLENVLDFNPSENCHATRSVPLQ